MKAVFRHELSSYFTGLTGYVFGGFLLLFCGIYVMDWNLQGLNPTIETVIGSMSFVFILIVPIMTMRVLADERRQRTDQLLYSLPLTMTQVVLGKYLAMMVIMLIPTAIICLYPVILNLYGTVYLLAAFTSIAGFFLLGAALLALGMYISSLTESMPVAAGLCFVVMLLNYYIAYLATLIPSTAYASLVALAVTGVVIAGIVYLMTRNGYATVIVAAVLEVGVMAWYMLDKAAFVDLVPKVVAELSLYEQFYDMLGGVFDLTSVVYLLSVAGFFLFLSVQSMEKRRWSE